MKSSRCTVSWGAVLILVCTLVTGPSFSSAAEKSAKVFKAGAATSNITPALGGEIVGGFNPFPSTHIHDELHARCLVLDNGETRIAFVVLDLLGAHRLMFDEARRLVHAETGLPAANLVMSATHTHSATSALGSRYATKGELDDYQKFVARRIADGVRRAINNLAPAQIGWASGSEPREVFNRRWFMKPGTVPVTPLGETNDQVKMNPPRGSANLVKPAGPTDPEVCIIAVRTPDGKPISVLANYSLHYVGDVGPSHISSDYYGVFCDLLQKKLNADRQDPPFVALMSNGTSGNINNIDFTKATSEKFPRYGKITQVADRVSDAALKAYQAIQWNDWVPLGAQFRELELGARRPTAEQVARAEEVLARSKPTIPRPATTEEVYARRVMSLKDVDPTLTIPLQAVRVGEVGIGTIPCEVFVETGLEFKQRSGYQGSFIMEIAHGYYGYLPTPEHHKLGGYETWLGTNRLEVEASTKILNALLEMVAGLK